PSWTLASHPINLRISLQLRLLTRFLRRDAIATISPPARVQLPPSAHRLQFCLMPSDPDLAPSLSRDEIALKYLEQLPFVPYPVQEQALFAWFGSGEGVLVCAPTGMGKTLIAEAAAYEALHTGSTI